MTRCAGAPDSHAVGNCSRKMGPLFAIYHQVLREEATFAARSRRRTASRRSTRRRRRCDGSARDGLGTGVALPSAAGRRAAAAAEAAAAAARGRAGRCGGAESRVVAVPVVPGAAALAARHADDHSTVAACPSASEPWPRRLAIFSLDASSTLWPRRLDAASTLASTLWVRPHLR